jgi:predicted chitinase
MLNDDQLRAIMPMLPAPRRAEFLPFLQGAMIEFEIATPAREAAFVAQLAHESAQLRFMEEIWGPTAAQRRYEPPSDLAARLGNTEPGDGKRFKGRGPIQITGRANYRRFGGLLGLDLESDPPRAARPDVGFRVAGLFWMKKGLNGLADSASADAFREITRRINGGFNGLADRERFYAVARRVLGVATPVTDDTAPVEMMPDAPEPEFERGHEAIRLFARRRRAHKAKSARKVAVPPRGVSKTGKRKKASTRTRKRPKKQSMRVTSALRMDARTPRRRRRS